MFTNMNVWIQYMYWTDNYPTGPDDERCSRFQDPKGKYRMSHKPFKSPEKPKKPKKSQKPKA